MDPQPGPVEISSFYDQDYFEHGLHGLADAGLTYEDRMSSSSAQTRRFVEEHLLVHHRAAKSLFEIGAATGHLLAGARAAGVMTVSGIEISEHAAGVARDRFDIGLHVGDVVDFDPAPYAGAWDIVYAGDVLEHVPNPVGLLALIAELLSPGGVAIVRIPTTFELISSSIATGFLRLSGKVMTLPDAPYHLHEFTLRTSRMMFEDRFSNVRLINDIVPAGSLNTKGGRALYRLKKAIHVLNVPLTRMTGRFGDRLMVIARSPKS